MQILYLFILGDIICNLMKTVITIEGWKQTKIIVCLFTSTAGLALSVEWWTAAWWTAEWEVMGLIPGAGPILRVLK